MSSRNTSAMVRLLHTVPDGFLEGATREQTMSAARRTVYLFAGPLQRTSAPYLEQNTDRLQQLRITMRERCTLAAQKVYPLLREDELRGENDSDDQSQLQRQRTLQVFLELAQTLGVNEKELRAMCDPEAH